MLTEKQEERVFIVTLIALMAFCVWFVLFGASMLESYVVNR
jgi:hypothetical protein